ncbi:MAG: hypothetical protein ACKO3H_02360 [Verrucomicrobiota bacterium]
MTTDTPQFETLREAYAAVYDCRPEEFEHRVFWRCLHPHAWVPARWMWTVERDFFRTDLEAVQALAEARCDADLRRAIDDLENHALVERSLRRGTFRIRLSPSRLGRLLQPLLPLLRPLPERRDSESVIAPTPTPAEGTRRPLRRVDELKSLRRIHSRIVVGIAVPEALQEAGWGKEELLRSLTEHAPAHPELAWLLSYLQILDEVESLRKGQSNA